MTRLASPRRPWTCRAPFEADGQRRDPLRKSKECFSVNGWKPGYACRANSSQPEERLRYRTPCRRREISEAGDDVRERRPRAVFARLGGGADMDEAGELFIRLQSKSVQHVAVKGEPAGQPARAVAERGRRGDDVQRGR